MLRLTKVLMAGAAVMALAACGSAEVASPGEGDFGGGTGGGGGGGPTTPPPGTPATDCPTGFDNVGLAANSTLRVCQLPQQINGNLTVPLRAGTIYAVTGRTAVGTDQGANPAAPVAGSERGVLTIEAGVTIIGSNGADYLLVNRGSQIFAEGTATNPIIFTSRANVDGQTTETSQGQWGGVVVAGRAPTAVCPVGVTAPNEACVGQIEGTSANYGGNSPAESSGRIRYVQIRYSGFTISDNNELQSLTLAGVGSGTVVEYIQAHNSSDDGIEIFGGNVNLRYLVLTGNDDDGLDTDAGWRGGAQFGIVTQRPATTTSRSAGFEFSSAPTGIPVATRRVSQGKISNFTLVGRNSPIAAHTVAHFDSGADPTIINSVFTNPTGSASACLDLDDADTVANNPTFLSVFMSCAIPYAPDGNEAAVQTIFTAGANNVASGASNLTAPAGATLTTQSLTFINGNNENAVTPTDAPGTYNFFQPVTYIGAVRNAADTWWQGWTCGLRAGSTC